MQESRIFVLALLLGTLIGTGDARAQLPAPFAANDDRDDTAGVQRYLDQLARPGAKQRPPLPPGRLLISDTLTIRRTMGYRLAGSGGQNRSSGAGWDPRRTATVLVWNGPPDKPMLELAGCSGTVIEGVNFEGPAAAGILIRDAEGSLNLVIRDAAFSGQRVGIQCGTSYDEHTCANITYDNCHFHNHSEACVKIVNAQSVEHLFLRPQFNRSKVAIDAETGGAITVVGGGAYELETFLKLGAVGVNTRGYAIQGFRFDGRGTRTTWLAFAETDRARTYGAITFANCAQNTRQQESPEPLITVAPGSRVVLRDCSFYGNSLLGGELAHIYSNDRAAGELVAEYCDGIDGQRLAEYVQVHGERARYTFRQCGNLVSETGSATNAPSGELTREDLEELKKLARLDASELLELARAAQEGTQEETDLDP